MQQPGFSADLDSFDLLDVIQMITMSRRSLALQVNTGLEERGLLRFLTGELVWAEYGNLRGEEAFFALAAHKNGTAVQQPWNESTGKNVTQPLSRLIFQALQYRAKYASNQAPSAPEAVSQDDPFSVLSEYDDRPFVVDQEPPASPSPFAPQAPSTPISAHMPAVNPPASLLRPPAQLSPSRSPSAHMPAVRPAPAFSDPLLALNQLAASESRNRIEQVSEDEYEIPTRKAITNQLPSESTSWWEKTGEIPVLGSNNTMSSFSDADINDQLASLQNLVPGDLELPATDLQDITTITSGQLSLDPAPGNENLGDLPFWMSDQPTSGLPAVKPGALAEALRLPQIPQTPALRNPEQEADLQEQEPQKPLSTYQPNASAEHLAAARGNLPYRPFSGLDRKVPSMQPREETNNQSLTSPSGTNWLLQPPVSPEQQMPPNSNEGATTTLQRLARRGGYNIPALVSALQTLGYALKGFVAAAVMNFEGQPIAQVAIDDIDVVVLCQPFSQLFQDLVAQVDEGIWGKAEDLILTTSRYNMFLSRVSEEKRVFQILITTRESSPDESLAILLNVAGAIEAALR